MSYVLLIEPNPVLAHTYVQALEHIGHSVTTVVGAQEAVEVADSRTPDVIVLELQLSNHGGVEFLYELRSYAEWQQIPVIIHSYTSPQALDAVRETLQTLGVTEILYKPQTSLQKLLQAVNATVQVPA